MRWNGEYKVREWESELRFNLEVLDPLEGLCAENYSHTEDATE